MNFPMFAGTTNVNRGDNGRMFRTQSSRSMDQLDQLFQYKLTYANQLGPEKVKEIENDTKPFEDAERFRMYHAKGRFRGGICASVLTAAVFTGMYPGNGYNMMLKRPVVASALFVGSFTFFYQFWSRYAGYSNDKYIAFQYQRVYK